MLGDKVGRRKADAIAISTGEKKRKPAGRPTTYTKEMGERICMLVATHDLSYKKLCEKYPDLPNESTMYQWKYYQKQFSENYLNARRQQCDLLVEEIDSLIDNTIERYADDKGNLKIDPPSASIAIAKANNRKWFASKLIPKVYGDKLELERKESENEYLKEQIAELRAELDKKNKKDY